MAVLMARSSADGGAAVVAAAAALWPVSVSVDDGAGAGGVVGAGVLVDEAVHGVLDRRHGGQGLVQQAHVGRAVGERVGPHEGDALGRAEAHAEVGEVGLALSLGEGVEVDEDGAGAELAVVVELEVLARLVADHGEALDMAWRVACDEGYAAGDEVHDRVHGVEDAGEGGAVGRGLLLQQRHALPRGGVKRVGVGGPGERRPEIPFSELQEVFYFGIVQEIFVKQDPVQKQPMSIR